MGRTARHARHTRSTPTRVALVAGTVAALLLAGLPGGADAGAARAGSRASRADGFAVQARPGWIGAHEVQGRRAYRLTPYERATGRYGPARRVSSSSRAAARAAYVLSRYGARGDAYQAAAVDAAVLHLMSGGRYAFDRGAGARRVEQVGRYHESVTRLARQVLVDSREHAGPYATSLSATPGTSAGDRTSLTFRLVGPSGRGAAGVPVVFTYDGATYLSSTDADGVAVKAGIPVRGGRAIARATARGVPDWQLAVRKAVQREGRSAVGVAGLTRVVRAATVVTGITGQSVSLTGSRTSTVVGQQIGGAFAVSGGSGTRSVRIGVHYAADTVPDCTSAPLGPSPWTTTITSDRQGGPLVAFKPSRTGFYAYRVAVDGNAESTPAVACGAGVKLQRRTAMNQRSPATIKAGRPARVEVVVRGFDRTEPRSLRTSLHGPFATKAAATCSPGKELTWRTASIGADRNVGFTAPTLDTAGYRTRFFAWRSVLPDGSLILGGEHCGAVFQVVP